MRNHESEIADLRSRCLESLKITGGSSDLAARVRLDHSSVPALLCHLLAAVLLGCCHLRARQHACRHGQRSQQHRQNENADFA